MVSPAQRTRIADASGDGKPGQRDTASRSGLFNDAVTCKGA